ncbi:MAG: 23S rRNA (guanosine(2251)-2'-O)-methyltransferase RlmB [Smithellaceae bacterium]|nr:23S rRNA (guanosine(2251)-2'-O)-methyltransferase RlmB [Smithellaceae bacterium]
MGKISGADRGRGPRRENAGQVIYGVNPLREALESGGVEKIVCAEGRRGSTLEQILTLARDKGVPVSPAGREYLDKLAGCSFHQGVVGLCRAYDYSSLEDIMANRTDAGEGDLIVMVDGVTDPRNLGAIIRTAHCLGAGGVVIPEHHAAPVTATVIKASAGAAQYIPVAKVGNLSQAIDQLKERGYWIYGADADAGCNVQGYDYNGSVCLVMGSEGKGIRPLVRKKCDFLVSIPMAGKVDSLNVAVAAGIILYEMSRKR